MKIAVEKILDDMKESVEEVFSTMLDTVATIIESSELGDGGQPAAPVEDHVEDHVEVEAIVDFFGDPNGSVVLRATAEGAADIARKLLMMEDDESVDLEEIEDALGECANMVTGSLKTRALDPHGSFQLEPPRIDTRVNIDNNHHAGSLVFELHQGSVAVEIWLSEVVG